MGDDADTEGGIRTWQLHVLVREADETIRWCSTARDEIWWMVILAPIVFLSTASFGVALLVGQADIVVRLLGVPYVALSWSGFRNAVESVSLYRDLGRMIEEARCRKRKAQELIKRYE